MREFASQELIEKGWSGDQKYRVTDGEGNEFLLRVSPKERREKVERTFQWMKRAAGLGISICDPIEFGECDEGVYVLQRWIDGEDAEGIIAGLQQDKQYDYGLAAGRILRKIHSLTPTEGEHNWEEFFNRKIDRKLTLYESCSLKYPDGDALIDYIHGNRHLLRGRPVTYQHGDYHIGNMMIDRTGKLVVIDFDRDDFGDPWEEFNRIVWCAQAAPAFARGMVDGYFDGCVPEEFWRLLALYIAVNTISSLPWAIPFGEDEVKTMLRQEKEVMSWFDGMREIVPSWYRQI